MGRPVARCSGPSSSMISVPEAGRLPSTRRPIACSNGVRTAGGDPSGNSGNAWSSRIPIISQCPVVVSLPAETSVARPWADPARAPAGTPWIEPTSPSPSAWRFGACRPPTARAVLPSVSDPASPYASASGASPTPQESHTITHTRGTRGSPTSPRQLLAVDAQQGPRDRLETLVGDRPAPPLARAVGPRVHLREGPLDVLEVGAQRPDDGDHTGALLGAVRTIREPRVGVERHLVGVRVGPVAL